MDFKQIWERVKQIITSPNTEWDKIALEANDQNQIIINYAVPLAALGAITAFIGKAAGDLSVYQGFMVAIVYLLSMIAGLYVSAVVISELAPAFEINKDFGVTLKLIVYSSTAALASAVIAHLHPGLSFIGLFGLYSVYLFWVGLPKLLTVPEDKRIGFVMVAALVILSITFVLNFILQSIFVSANI